MKTFDEILKEVGQFGLYQQRLFLSVCFIGFLTAASIVLNNFLLGVQEHRCKLPGYENDTFESQGSYHDDLIAAFIPNDTSGLLLYDRCHIFVGNVTEMTSNNVTRETRTCTEWVYDTSVFESTVTKELNMVCDRALMIPTAQSIMFSGVLVGSFAFGQLSDLIGRRKTQMTAMCLLAASAGGLIATTEYIGFCVLLFFLGAGTLGLYMTSFVLAMEFVGPSKRRIIGTVINIFNAGGALYLLLMVYLFPIWRYFTAALAIPICLLFSYYWITPESCRWLLTKHRDKEAVETMKKIAKVNKRTLNVNNFDNIERLKKEERIWRLFSNKVLAMRTLILFYNWFTCSMAFYGFLWNIGNLGGDFYFNFALIMVLQIPIHIGSYFLLDKVGRRTLHISFMLVGAAFCFATLWPIFDGSDDLHTALIAFALMGQWCVGGAFITVYIHSSEIFPTVVRNGGMGTSSAVARVGSMISPYIVKSADIIGGKIGKSVPLVVFGAAMLLAGLSSWFLPETHNRSLPETIEDACNMSRNKERPKQENHDGQTQQTGPSSFTNQACDT